MGGGGGSMEKLYKIFGCFKIVIVNCNVIVKLAMLIVFLVFLTYT